MIEGEAGIGKSTLLGALVAFGERAGWQVVAPVCSEIGRLRPFGALLDVLDCSPFHPDPARRRVAEAVLTVADPVVDPFRFDVDATWRLPVQEAIVDLLAEAADVGPTLVAVDDLQWADPGTAGVLVSLARQVTTSPLVLAWTMRSGSSSPTAEQLQLRLADRLTSLEVGPLDSDAIGRLGVQLLGRELDDDERARIAAAGGNPFFVSALLAHGDGRSRTDALQRWVERLPGPTGDALTVAALIGHEFDLGVLAAVSHTLPDALLDALEPAVAAGVLVRSGRGRYSFVHDLVRTTVAGGLATTLRAALHREIARALELAGAEVGLVARHLALGARPGDDDVAERIRVACTEIVRQSATTAEELLGVAAAICTPASPVWVDIIADRVVALQWSGQADASLALATGAISQPMHAEQRGRLRMVRATSLGLVGDLAGAAAEYRAVADDPITSPGLRALVLAELATIEAWGADRSKARADADAALAISLEVGAMQAQLQARCAITTMALFDGHVQEAVERGREAVLIGRNHRGLTPAREVYLALALANADEHDEAAIWFTKGQREADAVSDLWLVSRYQLARMSSEVLTGEWDSVVADAEAVIALHDDTEMASGMPQAPAAAGLVAVRRGASHDIVDRYRALSSKHANAGAELPGLLFHLWFEALTAERDGQLDQAAGLLTFAYDTVVSSARLVQVWIAPDLLRVLLGAGDADRAASVAEELTAFAEDVVRVGSARGTALLCRGLVARARGESTAPELLGRAAELLRGARRRPALLQALEASGTPAAMREALRLRGELAFADGHNGPRSEAAPIGEPSLGRLTPTERRVALLLASGLANPAIATELGLSKRTVEHHISMIYAKFGVTNRVAAARLITAH